MRTICLQVSSLLIDASIGSNLIILVVVKLQLLTIESADQVNDCSTSTFSDGAFKCCINT